MIAKVGVATLAGLATGGVGGLVSGGARATATGLTLRGAATFAGTAVLEAATFTAVNATASTLLFGEQFSFGSLLKDFAWNLGLFVVLRGVSGVSRSALRVAELQALAAPMNLTVGFPFAHGWGIMRFRIDQNRWPTDAELQQMTAESVLMLGGIAVGSAVVQRWMGARGRATALPLLYREYGWRFDALETMRQAVATRIRTAEAAGRGNDRTEAEAVKVQAEVVEKSFRELLETIIKDKRFTVTQMRAELNALREAAPDLAAELISEVLGVPVDVLLRRAGPASYTYGNGKTSALETSLEAGYRIGKETDPKTGLRTLTASAKDKPSLIFQERSAALDFDTHVFDVQKLSLEVGVTSPAARRMLWRILSEEGVASDPVAATRSTRARIKRIVKEASKTADEALAEMHTKGRLGTTAKPELVKLADGLRSKGILTSSEWLDARGIENQRGVVGEWLAHEALAPTTGSRLFRRVTVTGDIYDDAAGTALSKNDKGGNRSNVTVAETDLVQASERSGRFDVEAIINVKTSGAKGMARSASLQNANFDSIVRAQPGELVKINDGSSVRYARVTSIAGVDGTNVVDLTGKLDPSTSVRMETVGPKGAGGFGRTLGQNAATLSRLAELLVERHLIDSGDY